MKNRSRTVGSWLLISVFASSLSGCATIVSGRHYQVTMDNKGGATCFSVFDNKNRVLHSGVTPQQVTLKSSSALFQPAKYHVVYASQDGSQQFDYELNARINWWTAGNILIGGVPGIVVDAATGAMWRLQPQLIGQVPSESVVSNATQGAAVLAAYANRGPSTADAAAQSGNIHQVSFDSPEATQQQVQKPAEQEQFPDKCFEAGCGVCGSRQALP